MWEHREVVGDRQVPGGPRPGSDVEARLDRGPLDTELEAESKLNATLVMNSLLSALQHYGAGP